MAEHRFRRMLDFQSDAKTHRAPKALGAKTKPTSEF
jgi:hypothetical protein